MLSLQQAKGDVNAAAALYLDSITRNNRHRSGVEEHQKDLRAPDPHYLQTLLGMCLSPLLGQLEATAGL